MKVESNIIKALSLFVAGKKDSREYLREINFELHSDKSILTASNGTVCLSICINAQNEAEDNFSIHPDQFFKSISYEIFRDDKGSVVIRDGAMQSAFVPSNKSYPDFRRVIPTTPPDNSTHQFFDPEASMLFKKASKILGGNQYPMIHANGFVDIGLPHCVGVQGALRADAIKKHNAHPDAIKKHNAHPDAIAPAWLSGQPTKSRG